MATVSPSPEQSAWVARVLGVQATQSNDNFPDAAAMGIAVARMANEIATAAKVAAPRVAAVLVSGQSALQKQLAAGDLKAADETLHRLAAVVDSVAPPARVSVDRTPPKPEDAALDRWDASRTAVIAAVQQVLAQVAASAHPGADRASLRLRGVIKTLAADPATASEADEIERWLTSDDIIADVEQPNGFGIAVQLRAPLLRALRELKPHLGG